MAAGSTHNSRAAQHSLIVLIVILSRQIKEVMQAAIRSWITADSWSGFGFQTFHEPSTQESRIAAPDPWTVNSSGFHKSSFKDITYTTYMYACTFTCSLPELSRQRAVLIPVCLFSLSFQLCCQKLLFCLRVFLATVVSISTGLRPLTSCWPRLGLVHHFFPCSYEPRRQTISLLLPLEFLGRYPPSLWSFQSLLFQASLLKRSVDIHVQVSQSPLSSSAPFWTVPPLAAVTDSRCLNQMRASSYLHSSQITWVKSLTGHSLMNRVSAQTL